MLARRQLRVTIWNEYVHERREPSVQTIYPDGMHAPIAEGIRRELGDAVTVRIATLEEPEHGLTEAALAGTDVLTWWGHASHDQVADEVVERVHARVLDGMGIVVLHSGHYSKIFKRLMGTTCSLTWREAGEKERLWVCNPGHPIAQRIDRYFEIEQEEMGPLPLSPLRPMAVEESVREVRLQGAGLPCIVPLLVASGVRACARSQIVLADRRQSGGY